MAAKHPLPILTSRSGSRDVVLQHAGNELIFAVVGHVGAGTSGIATTLSEVLESKSLGKEAIAGGPYTVSILRARDVIREWAINKGFGNRLPGQNDKTLKGVITFQDLGDEMRGEPTASGASDYAAVARGFVRNIRKARAVFQGKSPSGNEEIEPDGERRAYILDSIRHPEEVHLLRQIYSDAFVLIGVVCEEKKRLARIVRKYSDAGEENARAFMRRDANSSERHGQQVAAAFHLSDYFVDNTTERSSDSNRMANKNWLVGEEMGRLVRILSHSEVERPTISETAMHYAYSAQLRSACLSRQVGASVIDEHGNLIATGTNEVPRAGGGVYGQSSIPLRREDDHRCAYDQGYCSNTREQNRIVEEILSEVEELKDLPADRVRDLFTVLKQRRIGGLLEFSRAVHAEMGALLSAARRGISTEGTRVFVTTFPCHPCARHLVAAGVDEVQYIEPYPKSQALDLHSDSIQTEYTNWVAPSKGGPRVLFRPFSGVAPRLYKRAFFKDRDLKDRDTGTKSFGSPDWGTPWHLPRISYPQLEVELARESP